MAEWLGCSIPDLYKVLEAMGHTKMHDPADQPAVQVVVVQESVVEEAAVQAVVAEPAQDVAVPAAPVVAVKPELATFRLKKGKANDSGRSPRIERAERPKSDKPKFEKKPGDRERDKKAKPRDHKKKFDREEKKPLSFEAKPQHVEDSPFAILQQLKTGMKE
jgi:ATP-dependent RNA helicase SUPV3L1/SUV3